MTVDEAKARVSNSSIQTAIFLEASMQVLPEGQYVRHSLYGLGVVTASDSERTTIDFDDHGEKIFVTNIYVAEVVGDLPIKPRTKRRRKVTAKSVK